MWICRYCAAHVREDVLNCPCCGTSAPARLQPELAESISKDSNPCSTTREPSLLANRGIPSLEKPTGKRAVKIGALLGLLFPVLFGLVTWRQNGSREWSFGQRLGELFLLLISSLFCSVFGATIAAGAFVFFCPLVDLIYRLLGWRQNEPDLPDAALAKTDTLGRRPPDGLKSSDNVTSEGERISSQSETSSGIHSEDD